MAVLGYTDVGGGRKGSSRRTPAGSNDEIVESEVLAATGERRLEGVRQLILRGMELRCFDSACVSRLQSLTVLSLSSNSLRNLEGFQHLVNLVELNLNFNAVTSLQGLSCPRLQRLYLSNNLISSTEKLQAFPKLKTLCLFKNTLADLTSALEPLRSLEDLRQLDLDGNPCARSRGYKHRVVRSWPRLHELDGEEICQLDIDLSALFFEEQQTAAAWKAGGSNEGSRERRPATAPAKCRRLSTGNKTSETTAPVAGLAPAQMGPRMGLERIPMGKARLVKSDRLNNDPQLLSYLAQGVLANPCGSPRDAIETLRREALPRSVDERQQRGGQPMATAAKKTALPEDTETEEEDDNDVVTTSSPAAPASVRPHLSSIAALSVPEIGGDIGGGVVARARQNGNVANNASGAGNPGHEQGHVVSVVNGTGSDEAFQAEGGSCSAVAVANVSRGQQSGIESSLRQGTTGANESRCDFHFPTRSESPFAGVSSSRMSKTDGNAAVTRGALSPEMNHANYAGTSPLTALDGEGGLNGAERIATSGEATRRVEPDDQLPPPPPPPPLPASYPPPCYSGTAGLDPSDPYTTIRKLLKLVESLQLERALHADSGSHRQDPWLVCNDGRASKIRKNPRIDADNTTETIEDIRRLRLENRNMHLLLVENRELKSQAKKDSARGEEERRALRGELGTVRAQLHDVTVELNLSRDNLQREAVITSGSAECGSSVDGSTTSAGLATGTPRTISSALSSGWRPGSAVATLPAEGSRDEESGDEELEDLLRRNEQTMGQIRRDLELARREGLGASSANQQRPASAAVGVSSADAATFFGRGGPTSAASKEKYDVGRAKEPASVLTLPILTPKGGQGREQRESLKGFHRSDGVGEEGVYLAAGGRDCGQSVSAQTTQVLGSVTPCSEPPSVSELLAWFGGNTTITTKNDSLLLGDKNSGGAKGGNIDGVHDRRGGSCSSSSCSACPMLDETPQPPTERLYGDACSAQIRSGNGCGMGFDASGRRDAARCRRRGDKDGNGSSAATGVQRERQIPPCSNGVGGGVSSDEGGGGRVTLVVANARALLMSEDGREWG